MNETKHQHTKAKTTLLPDIREHFNGIFILASSFDFNFYFHCQLNTTLPSSRYFHHTSGVVHRSNHGRGRSGAGRAADRCGQEAGIRAHCCAQGALHARLDCGQRQRRAPGERRLFVASVNAYRRHEMRIAKIWQSRLSARGVFSAAFLSSKILVPVARAHSHTYCHLLSEEFGSYKREGSLEMVGNLLAYTSKRHTR